MDQVFFNIKGWKWPFGKKYEKLRYRKKEENYIKNGEKGLKTYLFGVKLQPAVTLYVGKIKYSQRCVW